jgi:hypothetical protein
LAPRRSASLMILRHLWAEGSVSKHALTGRLKAQMEADDDRLSGWCLDQLQHGDGLLSLLLDVILEQSRLSDVDSVLRATHVRASILRSIETLRRSKWSGRRQGLTRDSVRDARPLVRLQRGRGHGEFSEVEVVAIAMLQGDVVPPAARTVRSKARELVHEIRSTWSEARGRGRPKGARELPQTGTLKDDDPSLAAALARAYSSPNIPITIADVVETVVPIIENELSGNIVPEKNFSAYEAIHAAVEKSISGRARSSTAKRRGSIEREIRTFIAVRTAARIRIVSLLKRRH